MISRLQNTETGDSFVTIGFSKIFSWVKTRYKPEINPFETDYGKISEQGIAFPHHFLDD
jgi:hypothetical protein